jgi:uncharacterized membrane protein
VRDPISWLEKELPLWQEKGFVQPEQADRLLEHYRLNPPGGSRNLLVILFGVIGALLIGGGIMLIVAHNWSDLSRPVRAVLSVLPMLISQILAYWVLKSRSSSTAWREPVALVWVLSTGTAIAMISQTYHMPGSFDRFMITWMLLSLPVVYLIRSVTSLLVYLAGIISWSFVSDQNGGSPQSFWLLLGVVLPIMVWWNRTNPHGGQATLSRWAFIVAGYCGLAATMDSRSSLVWITVYAFFSALLWLAGNRYEAQAKSAWMRPGLVLGGLGLAIIAYMLTWAEFWIDQAREKDFWAAWAHVEPVSICVAAVIAAAYGVYAGFAIRKRQYLALMWGSVPLIYLLFATWLTNQQYVMVVTWITNALFFAAGVATLRSGVASNQLGKTNSGMLIICTAILSRFFDADLPILMRAVIFILIGLAFVVVNIRMSRKRKGTPS